MLKLIRLTSNPGLKFQQRMNYITMVNMLKRQRLMKKFLKSMLSFHIKIKFALGWDGVMSD